MVYLIVAAGIIALVSYLRFVHFDSYRWFRLAMAEVQSRFTVFPEHYRQILAKYFLYYVKLPAVRKKTFEQRLLFVVYSKQFIPRQFDIVTDEMKVMIAASIVQLTFGFAKVPLAHFDKILIYPNDYYSSLTKRYHKGEVNPAHRVIVLSWKSFLDGYFQSKDAINLGLHEMAHALRLENLILLEKTLDKTMLAEFDRWSEEMCKDQGGDLKLFRSYAYTNKHEFFSVAVENFFERPAQFKWQFPAQYQIMTRLFKQDPLQLNHTNEYLAVK